MGIYRNFRTRLRIFLRQRAERLAEPDPRQAPHRGLVHDLLCAHLPPLDVRLRRELISEFVLRLCELEPSADAFAEETRAGQTLVLALRVEQSVAVLEAELRQAQRRFANFNGLYVQLADGEERQRLMEEFLTETASDRRRLREDIQAMKRHLGVDALRERTAEAVHRLSVMIELALGFVAEALSWVSEHAPDAAVVDHVIDNDLVTFFADRLRDSDRWQNRLAAVSGLQKLTHILTRSGPADRLARAFTAESLDILAKAAETLDDHPWVQARATFVLLVADRARGLAIMDKRLFAYGDAPPAADFLVRRLLVEHAVESLPPDDARALLVRLVSKRDPSEHVRIGLCELSLHLEGPLARRLLRKLAGLDPAVPESSARVRASAAIAARRLALATGLDDHHVAEDADEIIIAVLRQDPATLCRDFACGELARLAQNLRATNRLAALHARAPLWKKALRAMASDPAAAPAAAEAASAAAEVIERETDSARLALTTELAAMLPEVAPGKTKAFARSAFGDAAAAVLADPITTGRVLADLARRDFGLSIRIEKGRVVVWRGDRFRRRLWRILHEIRVRAPNKRQAFVHTIGRIMRGALRAHPGWMHEETATTVPGERVLVEKEGSWGRHVPTVDDALDLPLFSTAPVHLFSSYGATVLTPPRGFFKRLSNRLRISLGYQKLAALRTTSLASIEPRERRAFTDRLRADFRIDVAFEPYAAEGDASWPVHRRVAELFRPEEPPPAQIPEAAAVVAFGSPLDQVRDWLDVNSYYFLSPTENSQTALALFAGLMAIGYVANAFSKRQAIAKSREAIPLSIGGWGTRGKSGTERIKCGLLQGMGYDVFVKTTGCEAMFMHSAPGQAPLEIFIYRAYDKATIWEQADMLHLGQRLGAQVFLWECMALNPKYVELLQHEWMRDDMVTLTNAYPDHEDIQGPAGQDVAHVITRFIPHKSILITSEQNFLPMFRTVARERDTRIEVVDEREPDLIAEDMLDLFPYREHPRNIALVTRMAAELGIERDFAQYTMSQYVLPDLGVLKAYGPVRIRGRRAQFINGCSANERTGFIVSWRRMGLDDVDPNDEPREMVLCVVNNRADRIARSEVFARILARDVKADQIVLIGTNLKGLKGYLDTALATYLSEVELFNEDDFKPGADPTAPAQRLDVQMRRLRIPRPDADIVVRRFVTWSAGSGFVAPADGVRALGVFVAEFLAEARQGSLDRAAIEAQLSSNGRLTALLEGILVLPDAPAAGPAHETEALEPATREDFVAHARNQLALVAVRARLEAEMERTFAAGASAIAAFRPVFRETFKALFLDKVFEVEDSSTKGDKIILKCATLVPPGTNLRVMGMQNIKGTGLDFVYRWLAIDRVRLLVADLQSPRPEKRAAALAELESFEDHGAYDTGFARGALARPPAHPRVGEEAATHDRVLRKVEAIHADKRADLTRVAKRDRLDRMLDNVEGWLDFADAVRRRRFSNQLQDDLVARRVSHARAALEMRRVMGRQKGGWLSKAVRRPRG
jgi:poly-gamma-glutamate synthase PgsB/CapB